MNRLDTVQHIINALKAEGIKAEGIHGNMDQGTRDFDAADDAG